MKSRFVLLVFLSLAGTMNSGFAEPPCRSDAEKYCKGMTFDEISRCLLKEEDLISRGCAEALQAGQNKRAECVRARQEICGSKTIGNGLGKCLLANEPAFVRACEKHPK